MIRRWSHLIRKQRRRLLAGVVLLAYLGAIFGFPAPAAQATDQSQPYPCQGHLCGCRNADDCWRHCCCHTPSERLQWAQAHHVEPPAALAADCGWRSERLRDQQTTKSEPESSCCSACSEPAPRKSCGSSPSPKGVKLGMSAFRCRGLSTIWVSAGVVLPPPAKASWHLQPAPPLDCLLLPEALPIAVALLPPDPPPRVSI